MEKSEVEDTVKEIVKEANALKNKHTDEKKAQVNYACIFAQNQKEYNQLVKTANQMGKVVRDTPTGPLFEIDPLNTEAGALRLLKIRMPDKTRPEKGDADFTVSNYQTFKEKFLAKPGFKSMNRPDHEMIELVDEKFTVRAYFSDPPLDKILGLK